MNYGFAKLTHNYTSYMLLNNFGSEWGHLCMFIAVKALFNCDNCIFKANEKCTVVCIYTKNVVNSNRITTQLCSVLCLLESPV